MFRPGNEIWHQVCWFNLWWGYYEVYSIFGRYVQWFFMLLRCTDQVWHQPKHNSSGLAVMQSRHLGRRARTRRTQHPP